MKRNILRRTGALLMSLSLALSLVLPVAADTATGIQLNKTTLTLEASKTETLTATLLPEGADKTEITWSSSNTAVATVNGGTVTAVAAGEATITASITVTTPDETEGPEEGGDDSGTAAQAETTYTATCTVTVTAPTVAVTSVTLNKNSLTLTEGNSETLTATVAPDNATDKTVTWSSSNTAVATVSDGTVNARATGTATITATASGKTATCTVTVSAAVKAPTDVTLSTGSTLRFNQGDSAKTITATVHPDGSVQSVTWETSDPDGKIFTIDENYSADGLTILVTPVGPGEATITAVATENTTIRSTPCTVTVSGIALTAADGSDSLSIYINGSGDATYKRFGAVAETQDSVVWQSSDNLVASVNGGKITGRGIGTANITATVGNYTSPPLKVTVTENTANIIESDITAGERYDFSDILSSLNQLSTQLTATGRGLNYLTNLSVSPTEGVLYYGYVSSSDTGYGVGSTEKYYYSSAALGERTISGLTFIPNPSYSGVATITYNGFSTNNESFAGIIRLNVAGLDDVTYSTTVGTPVEFNASDFNTACRARTGRDLSYVTFELPSSTRGTLYYGYSSQALYSEKVTSTTQYYRTRIPYLEEITFVPVENYTGTLRITYRGVDTAGISYTGRVTITITDQKTAGDGDVYYSADQGEKVTFKATDFNTACRNALGETLDYVRFDLPSSTQGTLYYNYKSSSSYDSVVSSSRRYYRSGTPSISYITFVPSSSRTQDRVTINFTAYGTSGDRFDGTVVIQYADEYSDGVVTYSTQSGQAAQFEAADFNELSLDITGRNLNYIRFDALPSSTQGTLYYNYTSSSSVGSKVSTTTRLYRSSTPSLSRVAFVAKSGYTGTVSISFTAYDTSGSHFSGTVRIQVEEGNLDITYNVRSGSVVTFDAADFNSACREATGSTLNYVRFELPSSSRGVLYYKYEETGSAKVTSTTSYYRTGSSRQLNDVSFVASETFAGTVEIEYTGVSTGGGSYTGRVIIQVTAPVAGTIRFTGTSLPVDLQASEFRRVCNALSGRDVSYVQFTSLPSSSQGTLYLNYSGPGTGTHASAGANYYYSSTTPRLDQLCFVPKADYHGTVTLPYRGMDSSGEVFTGTVEIVIVNSTSSRFSDLSSYSWAAPSVEFLYEYGVVTGMNDTQFGPGLSITRGDFVLMLCRAFQFNTGHTSSFSDVPSNSYYAWAVATAYDLGIVEGSGGLFLPNSPLTRQDAMVMLQRAMQADGWSVSSGSSANLSSYPDSGQISDYARDAVSSMVQLGLMTGTDTNQLNPKNVITRAEMAVVLHRALTL